MSKWRRTDNPMAASVLLYCGHSIQVTENDGGMDELDRVTWRILEDAVCRRVTGHAVRGCDGVTIR